MLDSVSSRELTEWQAYAQLEPFGEERADYRAATIAMLIANANRDSKKRSKPYTIDDFMLFRDAIETPGLSDADVAEKVAAAMGAPK